MNLYFATWIYEENQQQSLASKQASKRLMSFYHLSDNAKKGKSTLEDYINNENLLSRRERS